MELKNDLKWDFDSIKDFIPTVRLIGAMGANGVMGDSKEEKLPWSGDPTFKWDMENFKEVTMYNPIIMGYNTYKTFKKPLSGRYNIVIADIDRIVGDSKVLSPDFILGNYIEKGIDPLEISGFLSSDAKFIFVPTLEYALKLVIVCNALWEYEFDRCFIIGGAKTYKESLEKEYPSSLILTSFDESFEGDVLFPTQLCKEETTNYHLYETEDHRNGIISYHEIRDPEWKEKMWKNINV